MTVAFAAFSEPLAWMIRGLVEYGWSDVSQDHRLPTTGWGGLDLSRLAPSRGRDGLQLLVPAKSGDQTCVDGSYTFSVKLVAGPAFAVRCAECNYLQQFAFDPANPLHAAGYIHQSLQDFVPKFAQWRLEGGELSLAQVNSIPEIQGEACGGPLTAYVERRLTTFGVSFDQGPADGWWIAGSDWRPTEPEVDLMSPPPIAVAGKGGGEPVFQSAAARAAAALRPPKAKPGQEAATEALRIPALALKVFIGLNIALGLFPFLIILSTLLFAGMGAVGAYLASTVAWGCTGIMMTGVGVVAFLGALKYERLEESPLVYVMWVYCMLVPGCCAVGIPLTLWTVHAWIMPPVRDARQPDRAG